uniref:Putative methyltransferase n=3 Tax=viral metagenome TaxID=1070528 RepID=A0A6M3JFN8_9ZZZZ
MIGLPEPYYETELGKLYHGDCLEILPTLEPVDLVLTDPPYGIGMDKGFEGFEGFGGFGEPIARRQYDFEYDDKRPEPETLKAILRSSKNAMIFGGNFFADILPKSTHWIFWDKKNTMPTFGDGELIWTNFDRKSIKKVEWQYNGLLGKEKQRFHPNQKPVGLIIKLLSDYLKGKTVADFYAGSGTVSIACERMGIKWIACEKIEKLCAIAKQRIENERKQRKLF